MQSYCPISRNVHAVLKCLQKLIYLLTHTFPCTADQHTLNHEPGRISEKRYQHVRCDRDNGKFVHGFFQRTNDIGQTRLHEGNLGARIALNGMSGKDLTLTLAFKIGQPSLKSGSCLQLCSSWCFGPACHDYTPKRLFYMPRHLLFLLSHYSGHSES